MIDYKALTKQLQSYWLEYSPDGAQIETLMHATQDYSLAMQAAFNASVQAINPNSLAYFKILPWYPIHLNRATNTVVATTYGSGELYGGGLTYGERSIIFYWDVPWDLIGFTCMLSSPNIPKHILVEGQDYNTITLPGGNRRVEFTYNIFNELATVEERDNNKFVTLWLKNSRWVNTQYFGYNNIALGIDGTKDIWGAYLITSLWKLYTKGPSKEGFYEAIMGASRAPVAIANDVVRNVGPDFIVTDLNRYPLPRTLTPVVEAGDTITMGSSLVEELTIYKGKQIVNAGSLAITKLPGSSVTYDTVIYDQYELPTIYGVDDDGYTKVSLYSVGTNLTAFWNRIHELGRQGGRTLAQALSGVTTPVVSSSSLLKPVNALKLMAESVFVNDYLLVLDSSKLDIDSYIRYKFVIDLTLGFGSQVITKVI